MEANIFRAEHPEDYVGITWGFDDKIRRVLLTLYTWGQC